MPRHPLALYPILLYPGRIATNLEAVRAAGIVEKTPNLWQIGLGVLRMWHRIAFRSDTIGLSRDEAPRRGLRARLLRNRALRFPFVLWEGSVVPLDLSGLASTPETLIKHLLGTHHDRLQFVYDMQILGCYPGAFERLAELARDVVDRDDRRSRWLRDLAVYENYHERLLETVEAMQRGDFAIPEDMDGDPDVTFTAFLDWCAQQPETPGETWRAFRDGRWSITAPLRAEGEPGPAPREVAA